MSTTLQLNPAQFAREPKEILPPSMFLALAEIRMVWETAALMACWPFMRSAPKGDGHTVFVYPGFMAGDHSTMFLRKFLRGQNLKARAAWGKGKNLSLQPGVEERLLADIDQAYEETGPVSLVGWSLGGAVARLIATRRPEKIRSVCTMGSPLAGTTAATNATELYEMLTGLNPDDPELFGLVSRMPTVPTTSIYSRSDGVVAWECSVQAKSAHTESIEVHASHLGMGTNPSVLYALADRLSQPVGEWKHFSASPRNRLVYPAPIL